MGKNKIIPDKIHLLKIEVVDSYVNDNITDKNDNFSFSIANNIQHNLKDELLKTTLFINLLQENDNNIGIKFNIAFHYKIDDLKDHYKTDDNNNPVFSGLFIATILGISFSTSRGIIYSKLSETKLNNLILPVIDPVKILTPLVRD